MRRDRGFNTPEGEIMSIGLQELGNYVRAAREDRGLTQDVLAKTIKTATSRSAVALLEQARRLPSASVLGDLCEYLQIPTTIWKPFLDEDYVRRLRYEEALGELVGRAVSLRAHDDETILVANGCIRELATQIRTPSQAFDAFNSLLVFYDVPHCTRLFFDRYLGADAIRTHENLLARVGAYQKDAVRLYSTFEQAYSELATSQRVEELLRPLQSRSDDAMRTRSPWNGIEVIPDERLPDLGYISAERAKQEHGERQSLAAFLRELADGLASDKGALVTYSDKKKRRMDSLLRKFESNIQHGFLSPLFVLDPDALRREADYLAPKEESDLARMAETQTMAQRNLARYLAADHLDVYVATSMRSDADFVSVNKFCQGLFAHQALEPLQLRYFNPTQSWIDDRVAKGLVEALMLKRSSLTLYMAQKTDTFGKDSEASVALGQGKPVIVYVPRLYAPNLEIDSAALFLRSRLELQRFVAEEGGDDDKDFDETMDEQALLARLLTLRLERAVGPAFAEIVREHWADFDLYGESNRIPSDEGRAEYRKWLDEVRSGANAVPPAAVRKHLLVRAVVRNELESDLQSDDDNYRLVERTTGSTMRVITRHALITNGFAAFYRTAP